MDWLDKNTQTILFWGLFAFLVILFWLPAMIARMGGTAFQYLGPSSIPDPDPLPREPDYEHWARQLRQLGYELLGDVRLQMNFVANQWRVDSWHRLFQSTQKQTYVLVQKYPSPFDIWRGVEFVTILNDDTLVVTKNIEPQIYPEDDSLFIQGVETLELEEVENLHQQAIDAFRRSGQRPENEATVERMLSGMERLENQTAKKESQILAARYLSLNIIIHISASLPVVFAAPITSRWLALTNVFLAIVLQLSDWLQRRQTATTMRFIFREALANLHRTTQLTGRPSE